VQNKKKKLIIFDADGTLFDSHHSIYQVWLIIAERFNRILFKNEKHFEEIYQKYHGKWEEYSIKELGFSEKDFDKIIEIWLEEVENVYIKYTEWFEYMIYVLKELENRGYIIAIATNNSEKLFSKFFSTIGKEYKIHDQISHKEVQKPEPNMIIDHMINFGISAEHTFMVGDTKMDLEAARNAGVTSIWAKYGSLQESSQLEGLYDNILESPKCLLEIFK